MKKIVVISGSLGVLGQSYSKALEADGYHTIVLDTKSPTSEGDFSGEYICCDITNEDDVGRLENHLEASGMSVYGLINNASAQPEGFTNELEDYSLKTYKRVLEVNLAGSFLLSKAMIPFMKKENNGVIINIGSIQGVVAPTFQIYEGMGITSPLAYSVSKAGMIHFCKWMAAKYGRWNIRCNAVSPGGLGDSQLGGSEFAKTYSQRTPLGRMARSGEVAEVIRFLMSEGASYITGQNILVDGGWTIY